MSEAIDDATVLIKYLSSELDKHKLKGTTDDEA